MINHGELNSIMLNGISHSVCEFFLYGKPGIPLKFVKFQMAPVLEGLPNNFKFSHTVRDE